jgi:hypothetical protein
MQSLIRMLACELGGVSLRACEPRNLQFYLIHFLFNTYDRGFMNMDYEHVWILDKGFPVQLSMIETTNLDLILEVPFLEQYEWSVHNVYSCK